MTLIKIQNEHEPKMHSTERASMKAKLVPEAFGRTRYL